MSFIVILVVAILVIGGNCQFKCPEKTGYFPDSYQCDLYYACSRGNFEQKLCPDGLVFDDTNPNRERCDIPANIDCNDRTELQEPKPSKGCPRANGYYKHLDPSTCDKFFNCVNGSPIEIACPPGLYYDEVSSTCIWPTDATRQECSQAKRDLLDDGFSCPEGDVTGPDGRILPHPTFAHPDDCQKFYICRNGIVPQKGSCSYGMVYSEETFKCEEPEKVEGCERFYEEKERKSSNKI